MMTIVSGFVYLVHLRIQPLVKAENSKIYRATKNSKLTCLKIRTFKETGIGEKCTSTVPSPSIKLRKKKMRQRGRMRVSEKE